MGKGELKTFHLQRETASPCLAVHSFLIWIQSCENVETVKIWAANTGKLWSRGMGGDLQSPLNAKVIDSGWKFNSWEVSFCYYNSKRNSGQGCRIVSVVKIFHFFAHNFLAFLYLRQKFFRRGLCQKANLIWAKPVVLFLSLEVRGSNSNKKTDSHFIIFFFWILLERVWKVMFHVGTALTEELCLSLTQGKLSLICLNYWR